MSYKVVHWGTGATGSLALGALLDRADMAVVGLYAWNADKAGRDAAELIGRSPVGVAATGDLDTLVALEPDVLTYFGNGVRDPMRTARDIAFFLERGIDVVTTSLTQMIHPAGADPEMRALIEDAARAGGATLYASGIDPGFATSHMAVTAYAAAHRVDRVRLQEFADYGTYPDEQTGRFVWGFGLPLDAETPVSSGAVLRLAWSGTIEANARALGWTIDAWRTTCRTAPARREYDTAIGRIAEGTTAAVWFQLIGEVGGADRLVLEHVNWIDDGELPADWPVPPGVQGGSSAVSYRQVIEGDPAYDVEVRMKDSRNGLLMTAMHAINAIPLVVAAPPGIVEQTALAPYGPAGSVSGG